MKDKLINILVAIFSTIIVLTLLALAFAALVGSMKAAESLGGKIG